MILQTPFLKGFCMVAAEEPKHESSLAIVPKMDYEIALESARRLVTNEENWKGHLFNLAQCYGLIADHNIKNWTTEQLVGLFNEEQQALLLPMAESRHFAFLHDVAGRALLIKLWDLWKAGEWIVMRPEGLEEEHWKFPDFAETTLSGTGVTADYHRKLALIVQRVFNYVAIRTIADENGEKVTPLYLINRFGPLELVKMNQFFSANPTETEILAMLTEVFQSANPISAIEDHIQKKTRKTLGTDENIIFVKELSGGGAAFQITINDPKQVARVRKFLAKYGVERFVATDSEDF